MHLFELLQASSQSEVNPDVAPYGADIHRAQERMANASKAEKIAALMDWAKNNQPCFFGRLGAARKQNVKIDVFVVEEADIARGDGYLLETLREQRTAWKSRALIGESNSILYFFTSDTLRDLRPSELLEAVFVKIADLIFPEFGGVHADTIYTEAIPLEMRDGLFLFKAGINFFHTTAHATPNHDRRIPGGVLVSVNSVGHYANNLVRLGDCATLSEAVKAVRKIAWMSIGNGGAGLNLAQSTSWHNINPQRTCQRHPGPKHIPENFDTEEYSAYYQTDVMIPLDLARNDVVLGSTHHEVWKWLKIEYFSDEHCQQGDVNFGMFHGYRIDPEAILFNPWIPLRAKNAPDLIY